MKLLDPVIEDLMSVWIRKAETGLHAAEVLAANVEADFTFRETVGFHCQQAVEKYVKALLTYYQVEFPKTHEIGKLLLLLSTVNGEAAEALAGDRKSTRLNSSHPSISYAVFCLKKK